MEAKYTQTKRLFGRRSPRAPATNLKFTLGQISEQSHGIEDMGINVKDKRITDQFDLVYQSWHGQLGGRAINSKTDPNINWFHYF